VPGKGKQGTFIIKGIIMKKILIVIFLLISTAHAFEPRRYEPHYHGGNGWIAPVLLGGVIGYELAQPPRYVPVPQYVPAPSYVFCADTNTYVIQGQACPLKAIPNQ
jgi:hypothetical protein